MAQSRLKLGVKRRTDMRDMLYRVGGCGQGRKERTNLELAWSRRCDPVVLSEISGQQDTTYSKPVVRQYVVR